MFKEKVIKTTDKLSVRLKGFKNAGYDIKLTIENSNNKIKYSIMYLAGDKVVVREDSKLQDLLNSVDKGLYYESLYDKDLRLIKTSIQDNTYLTIQYNDGFELCLYNINDSETPLKKEFNETLEYGLHNIF